MNTYEHDTDGISCDSTIFSIQKTRNFNKGPNDYRLIELVNKFNEKTWNVALNPFFRRNLSNSRYKSIRPGVIKGSWSKEEDESIVALVTMYGKSWSKISKILQTRNGKQIRDRYINVLDPHIKKGKFTEAEDKVLIELYFKYGARWATIAKNIPYRTADMIKNRFYSSIKRLIYTNTCNEKVKNNF